jgi:hypothetical protein
MDSTLSLLGEALTLTAEPEEDTSGRVSDRLMTELSAHRTLALREALANDPDAAFLAVLQPWRSRASTAATRSTPAWRSRPKAWR